MAKNVLTGKRRVATTTKTTAYTATLDDYLIRCDATSAAFTITLPAASTSGGVTFVVKKVDSTANAVTVDANAAELIDGAATQSLSTQNASYTIICDGTQWNIA